MMLPGSTRSPERGKRPTAADARASVPSTGAGQSLYPPLVGSWGSGIFDDDLASDLRDEWQDALERGSSPEEATSKLLSGLGSEVADDQDDGPVFWIALATLQLDAGALQRAVAERDTSAIPTNLERWRGDADSDDFADRERLLSDLERRLNG
jgi:hypothetical protein